MIHPKSHEAETLVIQQVPPSYWPMHQVLQGRGLQSWLRGYLSIGFGEGGEGGRGYITLYLFRSMQPSLIRCRVEVRVLQLWIAVVFRRSGHCWNTPSAASEG